MYRIDKQIREEYCKSINKEYLLTRKFNEKDIGKTIKEIYMSKTYISSNMKGRRFIQSEMLEYLGIVTKEILDFFKTHLDSLSESEYDEFFFKSTINFLNAYNEYGLQNGNVKVLKYAMSAKLFNMIFKYLSCFEDYDLYPHLFEHSHVTISADILYYFKIHDIARGIDASRSEYDASRVGAMYFEPNSPSNYHLNKLDLGAYKTLLNDYRPKLKEIYPLHSLLNSEFNIWKYVKEFREDDSLIFKLSKEY